MNRGTLTSFAALSKEHTEEDHELWREMSREIEPLRGDLCPEFLDGFAMLGISGEGVPDIEEVIARLFEISGWTLSPVPQTMNTEMGFFAHLLAGERYPVCVSMRKPEHRYFSPYPDFWHDLRHAAMITNKSVRNFLQALGKWGMKASGPEAEQAFWRIYSGAIETGLMLVDGEMKALGAACASSSTELIKCMSPGIKRRPFRLANVIETAYDDTKPRKEYWYFHGFNELDELAKSFSNLNELVLA